MPQYCNYYDCGWCYHPDLKLNNGCPGLDNCPLEKREPNHNEQLLLNIIDQTLWMAARYAHGRHTYAPHTIRAAIKAIQAVYPDWKPKEDKTIKPRNKNATWSGIEGDYLHDIFNPDFGNIDTDQ